MTQVKLFFKSDFKVWLTNEAGWETPFRLVFYTSTPSRPVIATYDGSTYTNCTLMADGRLCVAFDEANPTDRERMGTGILKLQPTFYLTDSDYADGLADEALETQTIVFQDEDGNDVQLALSWTGATDLNLKAELPAYYQKGDKGDKGDAGEKGDKGDVGEKGDKGDQGEKGEKGDQGIQGERGVDGSVLYPTLRVDSSGTLVMDLPDAAGDNNMELDDDGYLCVNYPEAE